MRKTTPWERLQEVMQELHIESPAELAKFCGVSDGLVSQWKSGDTKFGPKPLRAFARTKFSLDWIVDGELPKYSAERSHIATKETEISDVTPHSIAEMVTVYCYTDAAGRKTIDSAVDAAKENLPARIRNELKMNRLERIR